MNKTILSVRKPYGQPRIRVVHLGAGGDICDQELPSGFGTASGEEKTGEENLSRSFSDLDFTEESNTGDVFWENE